MSPPTIAFILATCNRGPVVVDCLRRTLACAGDCLSPGQFTITVIDNASTDETPALVATLAKEHPNLHLIRLPKNAGPVAKNLALHKNPADFLVLLDDDAYPLPGSIPRMLQHFREDPQLGAAVFDVTLPDGAKEASAYPDVFIGAGAALRNAALQSLNGGGLLPADYFMQAEEYDLSFRLIAGGFSIQRFWDMPLIHLKSPGARIGQRTTRLDVRNNLYLLAKYLPEPLCHQLAADWLARYWLMATRRDLLPTPPFHRPQNTDSAGTHKQAYLRGAAQGLAQWTAQRRDGRLLLPESAIERIFKFDEIHRRLASVREKLNLRRIAFADLGKNILAFHHAAQTLGLPVTAIIDEHLGLPLPSAPSADYRGIPIVTPAVFTSDPLYKSVDALIVTNISPVHAQRRAAALRRTQPLPVIDLFSRRNMLLHGLPTAAVQEIDCPVI